MAITINKKELISIIQNTESYQNPKIELEQYTIDAISAVDIIYYAGFEFTDIKNAFVFDLGAGTGRLSIASAFLKAQSVFSIDIDINALNILKRNVKQLELEHIIFPVCSDIGYLSISTDRLPVKKLITTIMNPPFGVQKKRADRIFLEKAFSFSDVVYSIHLAGEKIRNFITSYVKKLNWVIDFILPFNLMLERTFPFHSKKVKMINTNVYRFIKKNE